MTIGAAGAAPAGRSPGLAGALVAFAAFVGVFATTPGQTVGVSSFIDPIATDLGLAREQVLLLYSVGTFLGILSAPSIGKLVDRFGPRRLIVPVVLALAGACTVMSLASGAWSLDTGLRAAACHRDRGTESRQLADGQRAMRVPLVYGH